MVGLGERTFYQWSRGTGPVCRTVVRQLFNFGILGSGALSRLEAMHVGAPTGPVIWGEGGGNRVVIHVAFKEVDGAVGGASKLIRLMWLRLCVRRIAD